MNLLLFLHHRLTPSIITLLCNSSSQSQHLKSSKSYHPSQSKTSVLDFVPTSVLKSCPALFSDLIAHHANLSFSKGVFPSKFKHASVSPILKKPNLDPLEPANYRPISILNNIILSCTLTLQHDHFDLLLPTFLLNPVSEVYLLLVASDLPDHEFGTL